MKLSFVIPAFNEEYYIGKCLDSIQGVIKNSPLPCEIIVVNNASTDRTADVVRAYSNVTLVDEPEKGTTKARKTGYLKSTGDLIALIDADALISKSWLELVMREFENKPGLVALSGPHIYYDLGKGTRTLMGFFYAFAYLSHAITQFIFRNGAVLQGGNCIIRRTALEKISFNTDIQFYGDDADLGRKLAKIGKVIFTFSLPINISGRRVAKEGILTMGLRYGLNFFWIICFERPFNTQEEELVRPKQVSGLDYSTKTRLREYGIGILSIIIVISLMIGIAYGVYLLALRLIFK